MAAAGGATNGSDTKENTITRHPSRGHPLSAPRLEQRSPPVRRLLTNRAYLGEIVFRDKTYPGKHPAIVDEETFERAQALLAERGEDSWKRRSNASDYVLSGSLVCALCDRRFTGTIATGKGGDRYRYYTCASRVQYGNSRCDQARLRADVVEEAVKAHVVKSLRDGKLLAKAIDNAAKMMDAVRPKAELDLESVRKKLKETRTALDKYLRAFEGGSMPADDCAPRVAELAKLVRNLESRSDELEAELRMALERLVWRNSEWRPEIGLTRSTRRTFPLSST